MHRRKQIRTTRILGITSSILFVAGMAHAQSIVHSFDGDSGPGLAVCETGRSHCGFPDMDAAVDGKQVVQVTWQNVRVYDYSGHLLRSTPTGTFLSNAGLNPIPIPRGANPNAVRGPFEPHVVYNEFIQRWIVSITGLSDSLLVSASPDPLGKWAGVNLSCGQGGPCLDFDPAIHLGYDRNGVYYCAGHLGDASPNTVLNVAYDCFAVPSAEVEAIGNGKTPAHLNRAHNMPHEIVPAIDHNRDKLPGAAAFFLAKTCDRSSPGACQNAGGSSFHWIVDTFTWSGSTGMWNTDGEQLVKTDVGSKQNKWIYNKPCCGPLAGFPQAGSEIPLRAAESHRLTNLVQSGSHLDAVLGSGPCLSDCGSQGSDANNIAIWVDLDCSRSTACVVSQTAKISGAFNPEFPTVGVDAAGNIGIVAISATASTDLSILLWTHKKSDPLNSINGPIVVVAGTQPYTCENDKKFASIANPAGVLTALDPSDGTTLWVSHHWANHAERCVWDTRIFGYQVATGPKGWPFDAKEAGRRQEETARVLKQPKQLTLDLGAGVPLKLALIPAGTFMMGADKAESSGQPLAPARTNESPKHEVTISKPFYMGIYKVTQQEYEQVMGSNPSRFPGKDNPVDAVTWEDAVLFCKRASSKLKRTVLLPTEAQWEWAARAGTATRYFFGDEESKLGDYAWYRENAKGMTHPVGQKAPNAWGLFDVHGLAWEYCSDFYTDSYTGAEQFDPIGPASGSAHSVRGGTFGSRPPFVRSAVRIPVGNESTATKETLSRFGFRVAVAIE